MVKYIFSISDIHIPNNDKYLDYEVMLKDFYKTLKSEQEKRKIKTKESILFIIGDVYHSKKPNSYAINIFHNMLKELSVLFEDVYIVVGNHDMNINNIENNIDNLTPTFVFEDKLKNVNLLDKDLGYKSGAVFLEEKKIIISLFSIFDNFSLNYNEEEIETINKYKSEGFKHIGLIHANVNKSKNQNGFVNENGVPTAIFENKNLDIILAGDIHLHQELKIAGDLSLFYCSSLFQQNSGEKIDNHGFLITNLKDLKTEIVEVESENIVKFHKFKITSFEDIENDVAEQINL